MSQDLMSQMYPRITQPTFEQVFNFHNLMITGYRCAEGVAWKRSVQNYILNIVSNTSRLLWELYNGEFRSPGFFHFVINERGKIRDINSIKIEERVVQKALCEIALRPIIVPRLLVRNCASLPGRGTNAALNYIKSDLVNAYRKFGPNCNILITDYHGYYDSIDHAILLNQAYNMIEDVNIFNLFAYFVSTFTNLNDARRTIITANSLDPSLSPSLVANNGSTTGVYKYDDLEMFDWYADNSYFTESTKLDIGVGLGSEVSQIAAIAYVNSIDHAIKEKYQIKYYTRYMDDSYLIDPDLVKLKECFAYMKEESLKYNLTYNPKHTNMYKLSDHYVFLKKRCHITESGKVLMQILPEAIAKHRRTFKNQRHLLDNGKMTMEDIYNCFYSWRGSVTCFDSRNSLIKLTNEFIDTYRDQLNELQLANLRKI